MQFSLNIHVLSLDRQAQGRIDVCESIKNTMIDVLYEVSVNWS